MMVQKKRTLILLLFFVFIIKFNFLEPVASSYIDFEDLEWQSSSDCFKRNVLPIDNLSEGLEFSALNSEAECFTSNIKSRTNLVKISFSYLEKTSGKSHPYKIYAIDDQSNQIFLKDMPNTSEVLVGSWNSLYLKLPERVLRLKLVNINSKAPKLYVRDRLEYLTSYVSAEKESPIETLSSSYLNCIFSLIGFCLFYLLIRSVCGFPYYIILVSSATFFQFSFKPFFYFDEWHVLQRFSENSFFNAVIYTHNEHFLPLYFTWFYSEKLIFSANYQLYLLAGCALLGTYAYLVYRLLMVLRIGEPASKLLALLFTVTSMQVETLKWAFEQSILLSSIMGLLFLISGIEYLNTKSIKYLVLGALALFLSPFFFGGGFSYLPIGLAIFICYELFVLKSDLFTAIKKLSPYVILSCIAIAIPFLLYSKYKHASGGHALDESSFFLNIPALISYVFLGVGLGSILRPLGFYPVLSLAHPSEYLAKYFYINLGVDLSFSFMTFVASILIVLFLYIKTSKNKFFFFSGIMFLFVFFILFSLGRYKLGANQSLALRYQAEVLPGLILLLAPVFDYVFSNWPKLPKFKRSVLLSVLGVWLLIQFISKNNFKYFDYNGDIDRIYITSADQIMDESLSINSHNQGESPLHVSGITPGRGMQELVKTYRWIAK